MIARLRGGRWVPAVWVPAVWVLATGCGGRGDVAPEAAAPNRQLRAAVEAQAPAVERPASTRFGVDEYGRLKAADRLVSGFEVPMGARLVRTTTSFLDLEVHAEREDVRDFYRGVDRRRKRRFAERDYALKDGRRGFEVRHTPTSLNRLKLDRRYGRSHVFVTQGKNRRQLLRVHTPGEGTAEQSNPYVPRVNFESRAAARAGGGGADGGSGGAGEGGPAGSGRDGRAARASGSGGSQEADGGRRPQDGRDEPASRSRAERDGGAKPGAGSPPDRHLPPPTTLADGEQDPAAAGGDTAPFRPQQSGAAEYGVGRERGPPKAWGPYPAAHRRDPRPQLREWLAKNPGKVFLD